ncbi:MAG: glycosyltransferase family 2 protein [Flavitalea sp.]
MMQETVSVIVPLYNEEESFDALVASIKELMNQQPRVVEAVLVDDGSKDRTSFLMKQLAVTDPRFHCIFLSRNFGHQLAITAGLSFAQGTAGVMIIDGDLQDPPELLIEFMQLHHQGYDVVYTIRKKKKRRTCTADCLQTILPDLPQHSVSSGTA